jgi:hypothetical protein
MALVPRYQGLRVATQAIPGVRKQAAETPLSEGAGLDEAIAQKDEALGADIGGPITRMGAALFEDTQKKARDAADQTAILKASNALSDWKDQYIYDPNSGALTKHGEDAFPLPEQTADAFHQKANEIADTLTNDKQKQAFARISSSEWQSTDLQVRQHVFKEIQGYQANELQATVKNAADDAVRNAGNVPLIAQNLAKAESAITSMGPQLGIGPEQQKEQILAMRSGVHTGVISQLLATGQEQQAQAYFEETKDQISADHLDDVQRALEVGKVRGEAQKTSDDIIAKGGTLTEQMARARDISDPKVREEVEQRLSRNDTLMERAQREQQQQTMRGAYDIIDRTGDVANIPPAVWATLDGGTRSAMREYADRLAKGTPAKTDWPTYYGLMQKAADDPEGFSTTNLLKSRAALGDTEFKQLTEMQGAIVKGDRNRAEASGLGDYRQRDQILTDTLTQYGIDPKAKPNTPQGQANAELRRILDERVDAVQQPDASGKRRKASGVEIQQALDNILSVKVGTPGSWWGLIPFNGISLSGDQKRAVDLTIGDVPSSERPNIEAALRAKGRPVSDATVLDLYIQTKLRTGGK